MCVLTCVVYPMDVFQYNLRGLSASWKRPIRAVMIHTRGKKKSGKNTIRGNRLFDPRRACLGDPVVIMYVCIYSMYLSMYRV